MADCRDGIKEVRSEVDISLLSVVASLGCCSPEELVSLVLISIPSRVQQRGRTIAMKTEERTNFVE